MYRIQGTFQEVDPYNRIIFKPFNLKHIKAHEKEGWSPIKKNYMLVKLAKDVFAQENSKTIDPKSIVCKNVELEVDYLTYDKGWYISCRSIKVL